MVNHPIKPVYNENSKILILGSFPSVKSREEGFFYGHPQNRFWKVLSEVLHKDCPYDVNSKQAFLLNARIAVWDVIASCDIIGSSDSSIKNAIPNNLNLILENAEIKQIYVNGKTAEKFYNKYILNTLNRPAICLPSTSPANAMWTKEKLIEKWSVIKEYLQ